MNKICLLVLVCALALMLPGFVYAQGEDAVGSQPASTAITEQPDAAEAPSEAGPNNTGPGQGAGTVSRSNGPSAVQVVTQPVKVASATAQHAVDGVKDVTQSSQESAMMAVTTAATTTSNLANNIIPLLLRLLAAIVILVIGYLIASSIRAAINLVIKKSGLGEKLNSILSDAKIASFDAVNISGNVGFWGIMLFTLVAFFDALGLPAITKPLNLFLGTILEFAPRLIGAGIIFIAALVIANIAKWAITKSASSTKIDGWIAKKTGGTPGSEEGLASGLANLVYGLVFLLFLPAILDALQMTGLLDPVKDMVSEATSVLPDLLGAAIIFYIGGFVAKIIRQITTDLSESAGVNELGTKVGVTGGDNKKLSEVLGGIVYALILIPVAVSALNTLGVDAIADPATNMLNLLLASVPKIFGACIIVSVSYIVAKFVSDLVTNILSSTGFDNVLGKIGIGKTEGLGTKTPSSIVGYLVFISIVLFSSVEAANMLGFAIVAELVAKFITFAGDISLAVVVLGLGMYFANIAHTVVSASGTSGAKISAQAARLSIIIFASAMALRQTGIADEIVTTAFSFILGGIAVGAGLAFGLGCKDIAGRGVENFLKKFE